MDLGLRGRTALVFGASKGIGAEIARTLAAEGARVAIAGRTQETLAAVAAEFDGLPIVADLTKPGDADAAVATVLEKLGSLDILIVSVGAAQGGTFWDLDDSVWHTALDTKFMAMVRALRAGVKPMRAAKKGRIVVVVGANGKQPSPMLTPGSAANAACLAVIKGLADAVVNDGISVNAVNPGPTRTGRWTTMLDNLSRQSGRPAAEIEKEQLAGLPGGRIGDPTAMARLAVILASDLAEMVTGTSLTADGGATKAIA